MGFQAMSHRRDANATFWGCSGYVSLSGIIRTPEIAALPNINV